jgi:hypothetical protein
MAHGHRLPLRRPPLNRRPTAHPAASAPSRPAAPRGRRRPSPAPA